MSDRTEAAYETALAGIAVGAEQAEVRAELLGRGGLSAHETETVMADALRDALAQGVEHEDIDPSWFPEILPSAVKGGSDDAAE